MATFEVMDLNSDSLAAQQQHAEHLRKFEARKRARAIIVPTAVDEIKVRLREMGQPVTLFGETNVDRRDRLRDVIADLELGEEELQRLQEIINQKSANIGGAIPSMGTSTSSATDAVTSTTTTTTRHAAQKEAIFMAANQALIDARKAIADYSFEKAHTRILKTKSIRETEELQAKEDAYALSLYSHSKDIILNSSQYGDERPLTKTRFSPSGRFFATGSLSASVKIIDYAHDLTVCSTLRGGAHTERVTCVAWNPKYADANDSVNLLATSSGDGTCCLWDCRLENAPQQSQTGSDMDIEVKNESELPVFQSKMVQRLTGHGAAVLWSDFHPSGNYIATASADFSWRLWDVETSSELLLQDGHSKECSAISFQADGALAATVDWAGVVLAWDLRSGQQIQVFQGHVKKISSCCFHPNGYQIVTGGTDNTVRIWDLRKRKCAYVLPAHSQIISDVRISSSGELLATSSFDGTVKLWGTRDYRLLQTLTGHVGKVMSCDFHHDEKHVVSAGFDRTVKLWSHKSEF